MDQETIRQLLEQLSAGTVSVDQALDRLKHLPYEDLGFAHVDHHRSLRCGFPEVVFCPGKTTPQVVEIFSRLAKAGGNVLATRATEEVFVAVKSQLPAARYNPLGRSVVLRQKPARPSAGTVGVICAGTSDVPVAEEARETLEIMDQQVESFYDVGVAGLHRLLSKSGRLRQMNVVIVVAGMEGALPSVVGGLVSAPVIAVPTSVGYGASFQGLAALLGMLNSCAANVTVENIDNGFGAGYVAALINRLGERQGP
jgi:pyridinium-3,5-biscarboxylic acid mononucleotide synthase